MNEHTSKPMKPLSELTPEEKRIIVAEWLGDPTWDSDDMFDLNAIVNAVKRLPKDLQQLFVLKLKIIVGNRLLSKYDKSTFWLDAKPHEFTDALILTIGKATLK